GFRYEAAQGWLELDTTFCQWITVETKALRGVEAGQQLKVDFSHYDLDAPLPTQATLRLRFGSCDAWSEAIPIPGPANVEHAELASPCALDLADEESSTIFFHLDNHGQNTYQLQGLAVLR
ncbi:MAG TPA: hypothetical protein VEQ58_05765, partial [Polyangiaceae bacterium]|nr:hypothetical protein [Polyangiaceae bacterium]